MIILNILIGLAILTVLATLVLGALNMRKTETSARLKSNKLMQLRIAAQFVAVISLVLMVYLKSKAGS